MEEGDWFAGAVDAWCGQLVVSERAASVNADTITVTVGPEWDQRDPSPSAPS